MNMLGLERFGMGVAPSMRQLPRMVMAGTLALATLVPGIAAAEGESPIAYCGETTTVNLLAGQFIESGSVTVGNDEDTLYVTYSATDPWLISEVHLHVADSLSDIPVNRKGNPIPGQFEYAENFDPAVDSYTFAIPLAEADEDGDGSLEIAAHAVVIQVDENGNVIANETGWGEGPRFTDKGSWGMHFAYTVQSCDGGPADPDISGHETAFAYSPDFGTCFLDIDEDADGKSDFNRWGWTLGALAPGEYTFDLYAGAGQCDLEKGTLVGTVTVEYDGETATFAYAVTGDNKLHKVHAYAGSAILATNGGEFTVAPGQYTVQTDAEGTQTATLTITGLSGDIFVVAHAEVETA